MQVGLKEDQQFHRLQENAERGAEDIRPANITKRVKGLLCKKTHFEKHAFNSASR